MPNASVTRDEAAITGGTTEGEPRWRKDCAPNPVPITFPYEFLGRAGEPAQPVRPKVGAAFTPSPFCSGDLKDRGGREDKQKPRAGNCPDEVHGYHLTLGTGQNK